MQEERFRKKILEDVRRSLLLHLSGVSIIGLFAQPAVFSLSWAARPAK